MDFTSAVSRAMMKRAVSNAVAETSIKEVEEIEPQGSTPIKERRQEASFGKLKDSVSGASIRIEVDDMPNGDKEISLEGPHGSGIVMHLSGSEISKLKKFLS